MSEKDLSIVICCIDYRFWPEALPLIRNKYGDFDLIELAGSSKNLISPLEAEDKKASDLKKKEAEDKKAAKQKAKDDKK